MLKVEDAAVSIFELVVGREIVAVMPDVSWHCGTVLLKNVQFYGGSKRKGVKESGV
jgi:hypothetical protein